MYFSISSMLVSRFLLDLRSVYQAEHDPGDSFHQSTIRFAGGSIIGNMGAPLETSLVFGAGDEHELYSQKPVYSHDPLTAILQIESIDDTDSYVSKLILLCSFAAV